MKNIIIVVLIAFGLYYFYPQDHSPSAVADKITFDGHTVTYNDIDFVSEWSNTESINGYVRSIEAINMKNMPILTTTIAITTGDYSDPEKTRFEYVRNTYMIYNLNPNKKIRGTVTVYNLIPNDEYVQSSLDSIQVGNTISFSAKLSTSGKLKGGGASVTLSAYKPNEYVRSKMTKSNDPGTKQYMAIVESI